MVGGADTEPELSGFVVTDVPEGWYVSTSNSTALLITACGSTNDNPNDFVGKLAVLTASCDQVGLGRGQPVSVNGQPARVSRQSGTLVLRYDRPTGFGVVV